MRMHSVERSDTSISTNWEGKKIAFVVCLVVALIGAITMIVMAALGFSLTFHEFEWLQIPMGITILSAIAAIFLGCLSFSTETLPEHEDQKGPLSAPPTGASSGRSGRAEVAGTPSLSSGAAGSASSAGRGVPAKTDNLRRYRGFPNPSRRNCGPNSLAVILAGIHAEVPRHDREDRKLLIDAGLIGEEHDFFAPEPSETTRNHKEEIAKLIEGNEILDDVVKRAAAHYAERIKQMKETLKKAEVEDPEWADHSILRGNIGRFEGKQQACNDYIERQEDKRRAHRILRIVRGEERGTLTEESANFVVSLFPSQYKWSDDNGTHEGPLRLRKELPSKQVHVFYEMLDTTPWRALRILANSHYYTAIRDSKGNITIIDDDQLYSISFTDLKNRLAPGSFTAVSLFYDDRDPHLGIASQLGPFCDNPTSEWWKKEIK